MKNSSFGFDMGPSSLGHALINVADQEIVAGVRKFKMPVDSKSFEPTNKIRRDSRASRRVNERTKRRLFKVINRLVKMGFLPKEFKNQGGREILCNAIGNVYELRSKATDQEISRSELGLILMYFATHRGFLSSKKTQLGDLLNSKDEKIVRLILSEFTGDDVDSSVENPTEFMKGIEQTRSKVEEYGTLGKYEHATMCENYGVSGKQRLPVRYSDVLEKDKTGKMKKVGKKGIHKDRQMVIDEFHMIMDEQRKHHTQLTEDVIGYIYDAIFYQRPITWDRNTISRCSLEGDRRRACNVAKPIAQEARIHMFVNTIRYNDKGGDTPDTTLLPSEKNMVVRLFNDWSGKTEDVGITDIKKVLGLKRTAKFNFDSKDSRKCNTTNYRMRAAIGSSWDTSDYQDKIATLLLSDNGKESMFNTLQGKYGLNPSEAIKVCATELETGYSAYSEKALKKILPHLEDGKLIHEATKLAGYKKTTQALQSKIGELADTKNPSVNRSMSVLRKVHNALMDEYYRPEVVGVELARDLLRNTKKGSAEDKQRLANRKANSEARTVVAKYLNIQNPTDTDILKYRLWKEQDEKCIYSGKEISLKQLLSAVVEIDHILPLSKSMADGASNKVVCFANENQAKGNNSPIDAFNSDAAKWAGIISRIGAKGYPKEKAKKFSVPTFAIVAVPERLLNDTSYMAKNAKQELELVHDLVQPVKGGMVSKVAKMWNLYSLIGGNGISKDRDDNRHHAVDAIVIAALSLHSYKFKGILHNYAVEKMAEGLVKGKSWKYLVPDMPWDGFRDDVKKVLDDMVVSHEENNRSVGAIHKGTALGASDSKAKNIMSDGKFSRYFTVTHGDGKYTKSFKYGNNHHSDIIKVTNPKTGKSKYKANIVTMGDVYTRKRENKPVIDKTQQGYWGTLHKGTTFTIDVDGQAVLKVVKVLEMDGRVQYVGTNYNGNKNERDTINTLMDAGLTVVNVDLLGNI